MSLSSLPPSRRSGLTLSTALPRNFPASSAKATPQRQREQGNFSDAAPAHMEAARKLATLLIDSNGTLYSQWFPGIENIIADVLSRDFHLSDDELTSLLSSHAPDQMPPLFHISPVPPEISSWLTSLLRTQPPTMQSPKAPVRSKLLLGVDGSSTSNQLPSTMTLSSTASRGPNGTESSALSLQQSKQDDFLQTVMKDSYARQCPIPWTKYHRPSGLTTGKTHAMTTVDEPASFYNGSTEATETRTQERITRRR